MSAGGASGVLQRVNLDARFMSLGGAYDSVSVDASSTYYNPAGLSHLPDTMLLASYMPVWDNLTHLFYFGAGLPTKYIPVGFGVISADSSGIKVRRDSPVVVDLMDYREVAVYLSTGITIVNALSAGLRLAFYNMNLYNYTDWGMGGDLSILWHVKNPHEFTKSSIMRIINPFSLGIVIYNILPPSLQLYETRVSFPLMIKASLSYRFKSIGNFLKPSLGMGLQTLSGGGEPDISSGLELSLWNFLFIRTGYNITDGTITVGSGIEMMNVVVDYGLMPLNAGFRFYTLNLKVKF